MDKSAINPLQGLFDNHLTPREIEILRWSAEGKTAADIAIILSMKERTVHFHVANAVQKMGACNKISAVVQAALSGMF
ncbi:MULTISPECIES: helix-turn-helix domain-containing protein [Pseudomonas]|jgi:DNA-binding CsgD family transcriptional regulator|uniref:helix-turn-helix domain-containing protein n=1 Tax=Pseudomonas TaxID=286 RepID=UPI000357F140|nr:MULTISPECIES: helix-turn-helix transcriptional regulator [Pseudomonas]EPJ85258.1 transcriptional regulator, LuxR family protein [Pseudomonas sp. CFII64]